MSNAATTLDLSGLPPPVAAGVRQLVDALRQTAPTPPAVQPLRGRGADLGLSIPPEHIAAARREAWAAFPSDAGAS